MIRKQQNLLDDQKKTIRIYEQNMTLRQFDANRGHKDALEKNQYLMGELDIAASKERSLAEQLKKYSIENEEYKRTLGSMGHHIVQPNDSSVKVNINENTHELNTQRRELDRMSRNKELLIHEHDGLKKSDEINRLKVDPKIY